MNICEFNIQTKKGEDQPTRWLVVQQIPYPDLHGDAGRLRWRNMEGLAQSYGNPAVGIGKVWDCYLLTPTAQPGKDFNRSEFAGWQDYNTMAVNGGAIMFRGKTLGEMSIRAHADSRFPIIRVRGHETPTQSEMDMIKALIIPKLVDFVGGRKEALRSEAIGRIKETFERKLAMARKQIQPLASESEEIIRKLISGELD